MEREKKIRLTDKRDGWNKERLRVGDEVGVKTEDGNVREEIFYRCLKGGGGDVEWAAERVAAGGGVSGKKERTMYRYRDRKVCSWVVVSAMGQTGKAG